MSGPFWDNLTTILQYLFWISLVAGVLATIMLAWTYKDIRRLQIPPNVGFFGTLRIIPLRVAIFLDLMDLALDMFAAPVQWAILSWLKLDRLKAPAMIEAFIPGTQFLPTMTLAWVATRVLKLGDLPPDLDRVFTQTGRPAAPPARAPAQGTVIEGRVIHR